MKKKFQDIKKGKIKIQAEDKEDLWYLSRIIDTGDLVKGRTVRKLKLGDEDDRNTKIVKKPMTLEIKVEKVEFTENQDCLRINGIITQGPDDVSLGSHHTISVEPFNEISIKKEKWLKYQLDTIDDAEKKDSAKILLVVLDREEAFFAKLKKYGYEFISSIRGDVQKKAVDEKVKGNFYKEVLEMINDYNKRETLSKIIVASPSFWKEDFLESIENDDIKKKIILATCSSVDQNAFDELLRREEIKTALKEDKITKEISKVESILNEISKEGKAVYGEKEVENAGNLGAIESLLITDSLIKKKRENDDYAKIEALMRNVDSMKGEIVIVSEKHEGGKKLDGLGGIAALTRYKIII